MRLAEASGTGLEPGGASARLAGVWEDGPEQAGASVLVGLVIVQQGHDSSKT